jgi:hypothetical protein
MVDGVPMVGIVDWVGLPDDAAVSTIGTTRGLTECSLTVTKCSAKFRRLHRLLNRALCPRRAKRHRRIVKAKTRCLATRMFRDWQKQEGRRNGRFSHAEVVRMLMKFGRRKS